MQQSMIQGKKYLWKLPQTDHDIVMQIAADYNLSFPLAQTLVARGFTDKKQLQDFILVSKEESVHDPVLMKDAKKAVDRLLQAIEFEKLRLHLHLEPFNLLKLTENISSNLRTAKV